MLEFIINHKLISSLILIVIALVFRWISIYYLQKIHIEDGDLPRRWTNVAKNTSTTLIGVGLIIIWLSELRFVALSIAAFAAALVIATRDFIQCFLGALYQTSSRAFSIGEWIHIGDHSGEVISSDWLTTKLLEVDIDNNSFVYTGKTIVIPNNKFMLEPVYNLNHMRRYISHTFTITRDAEPVNVFDAKAFILEKIKIYCEPFEETAKRYSTSIDSRMGRQLALHHADVRIKTTNLGKNEFHISFFCPTEEVVNIEQKLTEDFMSFWYQQLTSDVAKKNNSKGVIEVD